MKVNYAIFWDDENSAIYETDKEADNEDIFPSFPKAKNALIKMWRRRIATYRISINNLKEQKEA